MVERLRVVRRDGANAGGEGRNHKMVRHRFVKANRLNTSLLNISTQVDTMSPPPQLYSCSADQVRTCLPTGGVAEQHYS